MAWAGPGLHLRWDCDAGLHTAGACAAVIPAVLGWGRDAGGPLADGRLRGAGKGIRQLLGRSGGHA